MATTRRNTAEDYSKKVLGVLYAGYLDKKNPVSRQFKQRFVVLTHDAVHWFVRVEGQDLFGEERGRVPLLQILSVRILEEDSTVFEIQDISYTKRLFRCQLPSACEEWVSALRSAIKGSSNPKGKLNRRASVKGALGVDEDEGDNTPEVSITLVSQKTHSTEIVVARNPDWDRLIHVTNVKNDDQIIISTSNGGTVVLTKTVLELRSFESTDFEISIQAVTLASCLRISVQKSCVGPNSHARFLLGASSPGVSSGKKSKSLADYWHAFISTGVALMRKRSNSIKLVLTVMVMFISLCSLPHIGPHTSLLLIFSLLLSIHDLYQMVETVSVSGGSTGRPASCEDFIITIHGHAFTSPDAPINAPEDEIPQRFIDGCDGDLKEARRRWDITRHWREAERVNSVLTEEQPHFFTIKAMLPHYHCGRGKQGHVVYYERPTEIEFAQILARGISLQDLVRHWIFVTEYQYNILMAGDDTAKAIAVLDIEHLKISDLTGVCLEYLRTTVSFANQHYPERSLVIYVVNAPFYCSMVYKLIKPMVHENTQKKVRILSKKETLSGLQEHIDISNIPEYYGGGASFGPVDEGKNAKDSCRYNSPEARAMDAYVRNINSQSNPADDSPVSDNTSASASSSSSQPDLTSGSPKKSDQITTFSASASSKSITGTGAGSGTSAGIAAVGGGSSSGPPPPAIVYPVKKAIMHSAKESAKESTKGVTPLTPVNNHRPFSPPNRSSEAWSTTSSVDEAPESFRV